MKAKLAILGASGYTGLELIRLLNYHPHTEIKYLSAEKNAGKPIASVHKSLAFANLPDLVDAASINFDDIDYVFCCLPHGVSQGAIANLPLNKVKVIDLSADYRLSNTADYAAWYDHPHVAPHLQKEAVYGLVEINRDKIKSARLVANPGCYPTSVILPLAPLLSAGLIEPNGIISDSKSGTSGAGRTLKEGNLYCEVNESLMAYGIPKHRHLPEIEQELSIAADNKIEVTFSPHLIPMQRGILSTIYIRTKSSIADLRNQLEKTYLNAPFVKILADGVFPSTAMVTGTNICAINIFEGRKTGEAIIISVIDNLIKGASGQALQNLNVMMGIDETTALSHIAAKP